MRKSIYLIAAFVSLNICCGPKATTAVPAVNAGTLVNQLIGGIKPSSFLDSWGAGKQNLMGQLGNITSGSGLASTVSSLAGFIKPDLFKSGFSLPGLQQSAGSANSMSDAVGVLKGFEGALKPEAMTAEWASQKSGWLSALDLLK